MSLSHLHSTRTSRSSWTLFFQITKANWPIQITLKLDSGDGDQFLVFINVLGGGLVQLLLQTVEGASLLLSESLGLGLLDSLGDSRWGLGSGLVDDLGVRVELVEEGSVLQWVLLVSAVSLWLLLSSVEDVLDFVRVDDLSDIRVLKESSVESVTRLELGGTVGSSIDVVESSDGAFSPDAESAEVTSRSEVSDVESVNVQEVNSRDVSDGSGKGLALVVTDNEWTSSVLESSVSELTLSSSDPLGESDSVDVLVDLESLEDFNGFLGLGDLVDIVVEDEWQLRNAGDSVTSSKDQWGDSGGCDGGSQSVSPLLEVDLSVPSSPGSEWVSHSTTTAHVAVGTLA